VIAQSVQFLGGKPAEDQPKSGVAVKEAEH
jgi:hypothetical protein